MESASVVGRGDSCSTDDPAAWIHARRGWGARYPDYTNLPSQGTVFVPGRIQSARSGVFTHSKAPQAPPTQPIPENGRMSTLHPDSELICLLYTSDAADE